MSQEHPNAIQPAMLPLSLLKAANGNPLLVELKDGTTYNGQLASCDNYMNMSLTDVVCTAKTGDKFWKMPSCYIRGSAVKHLRLGEDCLERAVEMEKDGLGAGGRGGGRGRGAGRGRGRFSGRGGRGRGGGGGRGRGRGGGGRGRGRDGGGRKLV